ncbi:BLUF domain-containing protein [Mucilaginibacter lacusdianchii]|uniref:BLUF domain-containing protein n=1 Tax=Mucilaginibacter lacusdianchii TaxID=2684211 RepID=UPI00131CA30B|nr:BLUF domain-containing protein [Mucilaginibacter sp. JXJ CY 39]
MKLFYLIYISRATGVMLDEDLKKIGHESQSWNEVHALTGMLLHLRGELGAPGYGRFMQVLEGPENEVRYIFDKIRQDKRHYNIIKMSEGPIAKRNFKTWSMGVEAMDMETYLNQPGYFELTDDFLQSKQGQDFNLPLNFLKSFYQMHLRKTGS